MMPVILQFKPVDLRRVLTIFREVSLHYLKLFKTQVLRKTLRKTRTSRKPQKSNICYPWNVLRKLKRLLMYLLPIRMQHWHPKATDGAKFWISCKRPAFLRTFSRLQMIQNKRPWCCGAAYVEAGYVWNSSLIRETRLTNFSYFWIILKFFFVNRD